MDLAIDIGNTRIKLGVFHQAALAAKAVFGNEEKEEALSWCRQYAIANAIVSNVSSGNDLTGGLAATGRIVELSHRTTLPIVLDYETPETLGKDRIAAACGAFAEFSGEDLLVIDAGTCITTDLVTADGVFRGGNIAPGWAMRLRAMHQFTGRLPSVEKQVPARMLGRSTETALQCGAFTGILLELDGLAGALRARYPALKVVITGGDAADLAENVKTEIFARPDLVLYGLNEILLRNVDKTE